MGPTWRHFRKRNRFIIVSKIDADLDAHLEASWLRFWEDLGSENGCILARNSMRKLMLAIKRKNQLNASGLVFSWLSGSEVGRQNRLKIDEKMTLTWVAIRVTNFDRI